MAENLFLKSPAATSPTATAPTAPPMPEIKTLPPRNTAAASLSGGLLPPPDLQPLFEKYSAEYGVPLNVLSGLAQQESGYDPNAVGEQTKWGKAKGLLQNLDSTAKNLGIDPFNPEQSIAGAAKQLRERLDKGYSMEDAVKAHFGGDDRKQWGEKTNAYGQEVLAKASIIGDELMKNKPKAAPGNDLAAIQAEMDAKEPGRYKVIDPADIAKRDQERADIASGKGALERAQKEIGAYDAPSPLTLQNQKAVEDRVNSGGNAPSPLTPINQALANKGMAPVDTRPEDTFGQATSKQLQNFGPHMKDAVAGLVRMGGESIDNATLVGNAGAAGILQRMQDNGDIIQVQNERGQMTPTLRNGKPADEANIAAYIRQNAGELMSPDEAGAMIGMKPRAVTEWAQKTAKQAKLDTIEVRPDSPLAKYGSMIIGSTAEMIPALAASAITRNPAVGMSLIGGQVTGQSYNKGRSGGLNAQDAGNYALAQGMAEAIPEYLPIHAILEPGKNFFKGLFKAGTAEALQEGVTQIIQDGLDKGSIDPNMTWAQARQNLADAMIVGAGAGVALKAGVHGLQKGVDAIPSRNREAEAAAAAQDIPQAEPAPTGSDQQTQAPAPEPVVETPVPAPTGPLTSAAAKYVAPEPVVEPSAPEAAGEPVTVKSSDGEMVGTLQDYQDHGQGQWTARVLADDGNAYDFTQDDGVQIERASAPNAPTQEAAQPAQATPSIPTSGKVGKIPTLTDVVKPGVEIPTLTEQVPTLTEVVPTLKSVVTPAGTPDYSSMDAPQLRTALKETATAIKAEPKNASLKAQRKAIETAIKNLVNKPAVPAVQELAGDKIDKQWTRFADDSGSLNVPRADMPQIKAEHRGAMTNFLNARGIEHTQEEVPASSLKPTQEEFSPAKVKKALGFEGGDRSILISSDNHVLDGHHQWLAKVEGDQPVKVIRLHAPIKQLLDEVREFPSATNGNGATATPDSKNIEGLKARIDSGKDPLFDLNSDGIYTAKYQNDERTGVKLELTPEEKKAAKQAEADSALADTPEEKAEAKAAIAKALKPAVERAINGTTTTDVKETAPDVKPEAKSVKFERKEIAPTTPPVTRESLQHLDDAELKAGLKAWYNRIGHWDRHKEGGDMPAQYYRDRTAYGAEIARRRTPEEVERDRRALAKRISQPEEKGNTYSFAIDGDDVYAMPPNKDITHGTLIEQTDATRAAFAKWDAYVKDTRDVPPGQHDSPRMHKMMDEFDAVMHPAVERAVGIVKTEAPKSKPESSRAERSKLPSAVEGELHRALHTLDQAEQQLKGAFKARGKDDPVVKALVEELRPSITKARETLAKVRQVATESGADYSKVLAETDGVPDLSKYGLPETNAAETASKPEETASPAAKPASKPQQTAKARKERAQNTTRDILGVKEGEQFTVSKDIGYASPGRTYTLDTIDSAGTAHISSDKGSTSLSMGELLRAKSDGVTFSKVEPVKPAMEEPAAPAETAAELVKAAEYGASNKLVTQDRAAELRERLKKKLNGSQLNSGIDPEILALGTELAVFHIEAGVRKFADFAKTMAEDLGQPLEKVRPYLRSWFNGARDMMEDAGHSVEGMDNADTVRAELAKLDNPAAEPTALDQWQARMEANGAKRIEHDGEQWFFYPGSAGVVREDGKQFTHLSSVDQGKQQKNGWNPKQASDYVDRDGKATSAKNAQVQTVTTPAGTEFQVQPKVVEADSLITSNTADGAVNPDYPKELQPRDRSRSASLDQINDIASKLNPRLLGDSASATDGAPIVSPEGVVESGNGRTLGIQQAYAKNTEGAQKYRAWLESQGHDVAGMKAPVLVRERVTPMTTEELQAYTTEANERTTLALSATERAVADGKKLGDLLHLYQGGDVMSAANREFVRAFVGEVASKSDRGSLMDSDGLLSQDGRRRIEAALLAAAYDDPALVNDIFESADSDIKSIGGALLDAAGPWAQMRQEARDGQIAKGADITPNLMEAVNLVRRARSTGKSVAELVNQNDIFAGELDPATKDWVSVFYRGASLARARGRDKVADALLTYTQLARATQPGNNLFGEPELTGADLLRGTHDKLDRQEAQADQQQNLFGGSRPDDTSTGARRADGHRPAPGADGEATQEGGEVNAASPGKRVEPDRTDATPAKPVDATAVRDEPAAAGRRTGEPGASTEQGRADGQRDQRLPTDGATAGGKPGDQRVHQPDGAFRPTVSDAGSVERARSGGDSVTGKPVERERAEHIVETAPATDASEFSQRLAAQKKAAGTKTERGNKSNIDAALPLLLDPQRDDVLKTEQRFAVGNGMLLTNGTGTGKTASGMGVIVRSINAGKPNALVIVPSDKIAADWIKFAKMLGVDLKLLESTSDNGKDGQVITTYANFGANDSLALRDWDQFVADEAHYLSSNEAGEGTAALARLQALSGHHDGFYQWVRQRNAKEWGAYKAAMNASRDAAKDSATTQAQKDQLAEVEAEQKALWDAIEQPAKKAWQERWAKQEDLPKTLFLSATPFAYVKSVDYAEGYLFDYVPPAERYSNRTEMQGSTYNSGDAREKFFMQHFGYRMRYNKLTAPEAGVDSELMEQGFNQHLKEIGALSGRRLEVPHDYDRKFVVVDDAVGQKIDQGLAFLREHADGKYRKVYDAVAATFDYQKRMYLLESIKARAVVPMIKEHMKLGRKVVVFHDFNKGGGFDPFSAGLASITEPDVRALAREAFMARPDIFKKMDLKGLFSPIDTLAAAFPDALFFNGTVPKKQRRLNADTFNDDTSGKDLIVLQSDAGREGVSLHDTTGKHMRVLINLGMPGKPVAAIQIEGRTYRTGQASDAAFRYLTTGTAWEASAFASKIAERASTAENLALGTDARGLKQSFIDAYNGAEDLAPSADDGKGGKALDRELGAASALSPFDKARAYYFAQQKNTKRRDQREGVDYFATPEPVGFKMAEWANIQKGDDVLEPSAGHGAIARFFPPQTNVTMVEPSYDLSQRAALANGQARIINDTFEALHLTNKYDAVVMNPPYGNGGKTAIEHVAKAAKHLREGGRVVALIPRGGLTDKRLDAFLASDEAQNLHRVATFNMPASTFERAGTAVNTQVIVLEKHSNPEDAQNIHARTIDLSNAQSTAELFDRIEHLDLPPRTPSSRPEPKPVLIEHTTGKGKTITGIVRSDLTKDEAKEIDPYTFPKNGGWFIRSKHLGDGNRLSVATPIGEPASHQEVRDAITQGPFGPVVKKLIDSGNIVIHGNVQSLPDSVPQVRGIQAVTTPDGKVHLVAANLTPGNANGVLLHEMFHSGGETLVGSQRWADMMKRLDGLHRQAEQSTGKAREVFDRARERVQAAQEQGGVAEGMTPEEFGAYAIEEYEQLPKAFRKWVDDLVGAIKHWLFSRYGKQVGQVTPAQLRAMAKDALVSMALDKRGELFGPAGNMFSVKLSDVFPDIKASADATSFSDKIGPEKLPQRMADRWRQLTDNLGLRIRQAAVDRYAPLMRNDQALYGADTLEGSIASSSWVLARMSQAAGGAVDALLNHGRIYLDPNEKVIDLHDNTTGLGDTLKKLGSVAEMTRFMGWIAANRSKRLLGEGRENLFTPAEIEAGIKFSGGKLENGKSRSILYQQVWKEFQQIRDDVLGIAEQSGIITPEQRATWSDEFYVPFYRVIDSENLGGPSSGGGGLSRQQAYKKLKGGKQHLNDLLENTLLNFHHLVQASLKNQAASMAMINAEQLGIADKTTETHRDKKNSTFVMEGGEKQWYNVSDPLTFKAVSAITDAGVNTISRRVMRGFKRFFTNMTTITPQFVVANAIRDTLSAMATSPTSAVPLKTAFKGALTYGNKRERARMMASGGAFHFGQAYGQGGHEFKASLNGAMRTAQVLKDPKLIPNMLMKGWRKYHDITDFAENMNRAGIWEHNQDKGKLKAAFEARDLMDFSAHGDAGIIRFFTDVVPFLNARIQGLDKLYRSGGKPALKTMFGQGTKSDKQAFARFAAVVGALTVFSVLLYLRNKDDEDYRKLEDWQRDTYWPIKIGNNMFFIPKPFEVGSIATMGERLMEQFTDPTVGGDKLASRALHMLSDTFSMNPTPQAIKPLLELGYNENTFTGRPIEDQSMQRLSPSLRARPETTRLAEASSRGIESALDTVGAGNSALSPVQIDHLIQGYLGAVGSTAIGMADTFWRGAQGEELPARSWDEYQPIKRFYKDLTKEDNYTRYGTDFYDALKKSDQAYADLQHLAKYGEEEKAAELEQKESDVLALRSTLNKVNRDMSRVNAEMKRVQLDKTMDGDTKRMQLDRLRSMRNLMTEEVGKDLEQQKMVKRASAGQ